MGADPRGARPPTLGPLPEIAISEGAGITLADARRVQALAAGQIGDDLVQDLLAIRHGRERVSAREELLARHRQPPAAATPPRAGDAPTTTPAAPRSAGRIAADIAKDLAAGVIESPRAVVTGARKAAQGLVDLAGEMGDWLSRRAGLGGFVWDEGEGVRYASAEEWANLTAAGKVEGPRVPGPDDPDSTTGKAIQTVVQFLVPFGAAGKVRAAAGIAKPVTTAGKVADAAARGAAADFTAFDPHEDRLSNLLQEVPALQSPITEYLAAQDDDSAAEGRFKNAVEGLGLGLVADGLILGLKVVRRARIEAQLKPEGGVAEPPRPAITPEDWSKIGLGDPDPQAGLLLVRRATSAAERKGKAAAAETVGVQPQALPAGDGTYINWARVNTPEDVRELMQGMADALKPSIDTARRGKQTFAQVALNADQVNAWEVLAARREGQALNAEQGLAARQLWAQSGAALTRVAELAATNPTEVNLFGLRKMMATHHAIQKEVIAARTESARALGAWRIPVSSDGASQLAAISDLLAQSGGKDVSQELARRIAATAQAGLVRELDKFVEKSAYAATRDAVIEAWIGGLLSGPKTHLVNMLSNSSVVMQQTYERAAAARIAQLLGDDGSVALGEATAQWFGVVEGIKDTFRLARKDFAILGQAAQLSGHGRDSQATELLTQQGADVGTFWRASASGQSGFGVGKVEVGRTPALSSEALGMSSDTWLGRAVDTIGTVFRLPFRALGAEDEIFKTIGYRMELKAQALRQATHEVHAGTLPADQLKARIIDLTESPPPNLRLSAIDAAAYQTFTTDAGPLAKKVQAATAEYPLLKIVAPFIRTPSNIFNYSLHRTPLAPLFRDFRADISAGGARRDIALARMSTGTAIMLATADMALNGQISGRGPTEPSQRQALERTGWQPYSVKIGDRWASYNRLDPMGMTMGMAADFVDLVVNSDDDAELDQVAVAVIGAIANSTMSKTYMSGIAGAIEALSDPERYVDSWAQRMAGSVVPTGVSEVRRLQDPYMREAGSMLEAMMNRTPGLSSDLPLRRDLWGRPRNYSSGLGAIYDAASPIYVRQSDAQPIDAEILRLGAIVSMPPTKLSLANGVADLREHPGAYSRYVELSGNALKHPAWGLGAMDLLNQIVSGSHPLAQIYQLKSDGPDGAKAAFIRSTLQEYRDLAKRQLLDEFPELRAEIMKTQERSRALRMPVQNTGQPNF